MQQNSSNSESCSTGNVPNDLFREGCKTIMSILVILTNDCGKFEELIDMK